MALGRIWLGFRVGGTISIDPFTQGEIYDGHSLNNLHVISGVTRIVRLLIRYRLETDLAADDVDLPAIPWPVDVGVTFTATPGGETGWSPGTVGGDAMFRETAQWRPEAVARTGVPSHVWWAQPESTRNIGNQRIIHDKTTDQLFVGFGYILGDSLIETPAFWPGAVTGWMQVDYLLENAQL
jgi:hypothetical protein